MEGAQGRVQEAVNSMVNTLDKEHVRRMQADMYRCNAACCDNPHSTMEGVQRCIEKCSQPITHAQNYLQTEIQGYQERLQRCAMDCQDNVKDKITTTTAEADVARYRGEFEQCVIKCADKHVQLVPQMLKKIKDVFKLQEAQLKK